MRTLPPSRGNACKAQCEDECKNIVGSSKEDTQQRGVGETEGPGEWLTEANHENASFY